MLLSVVPTKALSLRSQVHPCAELSPNRCQDDRTNVAPGREVLEVLNETLLEVDVEGIPNLGIVERDGGLRAFDRDEDELPGRCSGVGAQRKAGEELPAGQALEVDLVAVQWT